MSKPFMTYDQQIELLRTKGLVIADEALARDSLMRIGYFQLIGGYKHPFKNATTKQYKDGVSFSDILALYRFDIEMRHAFLGQLLFVEKEIKAQIAYCFCNKYGEAQGQYLTPTNYNYTPKTQSDVQRLVGMLQRLANSPTDYPYINHQQRVHHNVPLWVLINAITFGSMSKMFDLLPQSLQSQVCKNYPLTINQMKPMLSVLTKYRNACAHGERIFSYTTKDDMPDLQLHSKLSIPQRGTQFLQGKRDLFAVMLALRYLLPDKVFKNFKNTIVKLLHRFESDCTVLSEQELLKEMGFPQNWKDLTRYRLK